MIKSYKDLIVWQKSFALAKLIYVLTEDFPKSELYGLTSQMRRCSVSIVSNIAEGFGRSSEKERVQFFSISYGSSSELETQLLLAQEIGLAKSSRLNESLDLLVEVRKMLNKMLSGKRRSA